MSRHSGTEPRCACCQKVKWELWLMHPLDVYVRVHTTSGPVLYDSPVGFPIILRPETSILKEPSDVVLTEAAAIGKTCNWAKRAFSVPRHFYPPVLGRRPRPFFSPSPKPQWLSVRARVHPYSPSTSIILVHWCCIPVLYRILCGASGGLILLPIRFLRDSHTLDLTFCLWIL